MFHKQSSTGNAIRQPKWLQGHVRFPNEMHTKTEDRLAYLHLVEALPSPSERQIMDAASRSRMIRFGPFLSMQ